MALPHLAGLFGDQSALQGNGANPMLPSLAQDGESRRTHRWAERAQLSAESAMSEADIILSADLTLPLETVNALQQRHFSTAKQASAVATQLRQQRRL